MTVDTILLVVASFLVLAIVIIELVKIIRGKRPTIDPITIAFLLLILLFAVFLTYRASELESADWAQIILMIALVAVTGFYALSASKQANASVKMAKEMKKQRYDTVRPVIDIQWQALTDDRRLGEAASSPSQLASDGCSCILRNIGLGPAIDVYSFVRSHSGERHRYDFGTIAIPAIEGEFQPSIPTILSPKQEGERVVIEIHYKDVYGQSFESNREVIGKVGDWKLGPLQIRLVEEGENND